MLKPQFPRAFYLPKNVKVRVRQYEDIPAMVALYDSGKSGKPVAIAWRGKAQKPAFHHSFRAPEYRDRFIADWLESQRKSTAFRAEQAKARNQGHSLKVGQVLYTSWGYDQTNIDFYQVTRLIGDKMVEVREIASKLAGEGGGPSESVVPAIDQFVGEPMKKRPQGTSATIDGHCASLYNGEPKHRTGFGYGH